MVVSKWVWSPPPAGCPINKGVRSGHHQRSPNHPPATFVPLFFLQIRFGRKFFGWEKNQEKGEGGGMLGVIVHPSSFVLQSLVEYERCRHFRWQISSFLNVVWRVQIYDTQIAHPPNVCLAEVLLPESSLPDQYKILEEQQSFFGFQQFEVCHLTLEVANSGCRAVYFGCHSLWVERRGQRVASISTTSIGSIGNWQRLP